MTKPQNKALYGAFTVFAGALILLVPAVLVGRPFIFWDTPTFYSWGHDIVAAINDHWPPLSHFPSHRGLWAADNFQGAWRDISADQYQLVLSSIGARSKFYALPLYLLGSRFGLWTPTILQALLVSWLLWVTTTVVLDSRRSSVFLAVVVALTVGTSVPFFATFLMPDIFAALGILATALLLCFGERITSLQRVSLVLVIVSAILVHASDVAALTVLVFSAIVFRWLASLSALPRAGFAMVGLGFVLALTTAVISDIGIRTVFGGPVETAPFLEGRVIADGPGRLYLQETCGQKQLAACIYKDADVRTPDDIIWPFPSDHELPLITNPTERQRFLDEQTQVVLGTLLTHPLAEIKVALKNGFRALADFRIANTMGAALRELLKVDNDQRMRVLQIVPNLDACLQEKPEPCDFERPLKYVEVLQYVVVALALIGIAYRSIQFIRRPTTWTRHDQRALLLTLTIVAAIIGNGLICGMASGPFERYQARVIWLIPMAVGLLELKLAEYRKLRSRTDDCLQSAQPAL
jgi:hypothetical protein